jgi:hypothetical protein
MLGVAEALAEAEGDGVVITDPLVVPHAAQSTSAAASAHAAFMIRN